MTLMTARRLHLDFRLDFVYLPLSGLDAVLSAHSIQDDQWLVLRCNADYHNTVDLINSLIFAGATYQIGRKPL